MTSHLYYSERFPWEGLETVMFLPTLYIQSQASHTVSRSVPFSRLSLAPPHCWHSICSWVNQLSNLLSFLDNMSTTMFHRGTVSSQPTFSIYFYITVLYQAVVHQLLCNLCYQNKPHFYNCTLKVFILPGTTLSWFQMAGHFCFLAPW